MINFYDEPTPDAMRSLLPSFIDDTTVFAGRIDEIAVNRVAEAVRSQVRCSHLATFDLQAGPSSTFTPEELNAIQSEALVVHGRKDRIIGVEASYYMSTHLPHAQLHVLPTPGTGSRLSKSTGSQRSPRHFSLRAIGHDDVERDRN